MAQPIPEALAHIVALNVEFNVLICVQCKYAVAPTTISRHLGDKHKTPIELRRQLEEYIREFPFQYDHTSVRLPNNRSAPQPIPVLDGYLCKECPYKTQSRDAIKKHGNKVHDKKRVADDELYQIVQLQSWFDNRRAQYWVVDYRDSNEHSSPGVGFFVFWFVCPGFYVGPHFFSFRLPLFRVRISVQPDVSRIIGC